MSDDSKSTETQTKSHSELFGLDPTNNSEHKGHKEPGSAIAGVEDKVGDGAPKAPGPAASSEGDTPKVGGISKGGDTDEKPGAGGSTLEPDQGTAKAGDE